MKVDEANPSLPVYDQKDQKPTAWTEQDWAEYSRQFPGWNTDPGPVLGGNFDISEAEINPPTADPVVAS